MKFVTLNTGQKMPMLGLGIFQIENDQSGVDVILSAIEAGYRSMDTAEAYKNEAIVGKAIAQSGISRGDFFVTTKVSNTTQREGGIAASFEHGLEIMNLEYVDLYLIHWPVKETFIKTWQEMEKIYESGRAKTIGVCNFLVHHLDALKQCRITPAVNQYEHHPYLTQKPLMDYCKSHGIQVEAYSPLGSSKNNLLSNPVVEDIAAKYGKTAAQILLRWNIELGVVSIPKSSKTHRIKENINIFDFELDTADIATLDALNQNARIMPDPDNFDF